MTNYRLILFIFAFFADVAIGCGMSISTRRGDEGMTDLLFGKRVAKVDDRIKALGAVDELNALLGVVRVGDISEGMREWVNGVQKRLVGLMGVIATDVADHEKYAEKGYEGISEKDVEWLDEVVAELEVEKGHRFKGWARPGQAGAVAGANLDVARTVCRRGELLSWEIDDEGLGGVRRFLNRLSDVLWLLAREGESV